MQVDIAVRSFEGTSCLFSLRQFARQLQPFCIMALSRGCAILAQFAVQLVVATMAGASGVGLLQLLTAWTCTAGELLALGLPNRAMRQVSVAWTGLDGEKIQKIVRDSRISILKMWLWLVLPATSLFSAFKFFTATQWADYEVVLLASAVAAPGFALIRLYAESLKSMGLATVAISIENLTSPLLILLVCGVFWLIGKTLLAVALCITFVFSMALSALSLRASLARQLASLPRGAAPRGKVSEASTHTDLPYLWAGSVLSIAFLQLPFLLMPLYVDTAEIGVFGLAHKLVNVVTTILLLLAATFGPAFARCAASSDRRGLRNLLIRSQWVSCSLFVPGAMLLVVASSPLVNFFGEEFAGLPSYLTILIVGQMFNAMTGLCGVMLNMVGAAARELSSVVLGLSIALSASLWVGPDYGAQGLAILFSVTMAIKNIASYLMAMHLLNSTGESA